MESNYDIKIRPKTLKILDNYIGVRFLLTFFFIISLLLMIAIVIDLTENLEDMIAQKTPTVPILMYYLDFTPWILSLLAPLFVFISVIFFTSRLTNNSEIIATISGGVSFYRLLLPYVVASLFIAALLFFTNHFFLPQSNSDIIEFKKKWLGRTETLAQSNNLHIQLKDNKILYLRSFNEEINRGYNLEIEQFEGHSVVHKLKARSLNWIDSLQSWQGVDVKERFINGDKERIEFNNEKIIEMELVPDDFIFTIGEWATYTTPQLNKIIEREQERGSTMVKQYQIEKHKRTASPIAIVIFTLMGVAIASRKVRGGTGIHLALGIALSAIFVLMLNFTETIANNTSIDPIISVWIPNIIFLIIGIILIFRAQK